VAAAMNRLAEAYHQAGSKILRFRTRYPDLKKGYRIDQKTADALAEDLKTIDSPEFRKVLEPFADNPSAQSAYRDLLQEMKRSEDNLDF
jgi:hypothetical protein